MQAPRPLPLPLHVTLGNLRDRGFRPAGPSGSSDSVLISSLCGPVQILPPLQPPRLLLYEGGHNENNEIGFRNQKWLVTFPTAKQAGEAEQWEIKGTECCPQSRHFCPWEGVTQETGSYLP